MTKTLLAGLSLVGLTLALSAPAFAFGPDEFGGFHGKVKIFANGIGNADGIDGNAGAATGTEDDGEGYGITGAVANNTLVQVSTNTAQANGFIVKMASGMDFGTDTFREQKVVVNNFNTAVNTAQQGAIALAGQNNAN